METNKALSNARRYFNLARQAHYNRSSPVPDMLNMLEQLLIALEIREEIETKPERENPNDDRY